MSRARVRSEREQLADQLGSLVQASLLSRSRGGKFGLYPLEHPRQRNERKYLNDPVTAFPSRSDAALWEAFRI
jgi:hypothetical protein